MLKCFDTVFAGHFPQKQRKNFRKVSSYPEMRVRTQIEAKNIDIILDTLDVETEQIIGDSSRIRQILTNLISNAIKFTEQGKVRLSVALKPLDDGCVLVVSVKDTGVGISPEKQASIFEQFSQEDVSTTRQFGGTGLGLSISQQLSHLLGGEIKVASQKGQGSQFRVTFSVATLEREKHVVEPSPEYESVDLSAHRECKVLLVEDNHINQVVAQQQLDGHQVDIAENGQSALDQLRANPSFYDVILMDCQMPVMDGFEASERIRAGEAGDTQRNIPIIALTANAMKGDKERCLEAGMHDYLSKPFDAVVLNQKVRFWAEKE